MARDKTYRYSVSAVFAPNARYEGIWNCKTMGQPTDENLHAWVILGKQVNGDTTIRAQINGVGLLSPVATYVA